VLFFGSLVFAGLSSLISIVEASVSAIDDKFGLGRRRAVALVGGGTATVSLLYATAGGVNFLDVVDNFVNLFGVAVVGLVEVVVVAWLLRRVGDAAAARGPAVGDPPAAVVGRRPDRGHPGVARLVTIDNLRGELAEPYSTADGTYPVGFVVGLGWGAAALALAIGVALTLPAVAQLRTAHPPRPAPRGAPVSTAAVAVMVVAVVTIVGGLIASIVVAVRADRAGRR
jgi:neurotransmitter:Na+ symporter, NSS family